MAAAGTSQARASDTPNAANIGLRTVSALLGGYAFVYALTAAASLVLFRAGVGRVDAANLSTNLAILTYPGIAIWAFARRSLVEAVGAPLVVAGALAVVAFLFRL